MVFLFSRLAARPTAQWLVFIVVFSLSGSLSGCLSTGVRSTGAVLPQASETISTDWAVIEFSHNCSGGRCTGLDVTFQNLLDEVLEVRVPESKMTRAGESLSLVHDEKVPKSLISIPPKEKISASFITVDPVGKTGVTAPGNISIAKKFPMTYVRPKEVWCSLKVDSACTSPNVGEADCAAVARTYYQQYVDLKGWIEVSFAVKPKSANKFEVVRNQAPQFMGIKPPVELSVEGSSPFWYGLNSQHTVFSRYSCNDKCACSPLEATRDFVTDDKFLPVEQK
jgi:hypothetical protein